MRNIYTTSTGLQIGCMYQSNVRPAHDKDAIKLQDALLQKRGQASTVLRRVIRAIWDWL